MKKTHLPTLGASALCVVTLMPVTCPAEPTTAASVIDDSGNYGDSYGYGRGRNLGIPGVLADLILLRPVGLAMTIGGIGLLVATSPFTGIASYAPPHDAFLRASNALVVGPAGFTFNRPLGEFTYQRSGVYPVLTKPIDRPIQGPIPQAPQRSTRATTPANAPPSRPIYQYSPDRLEYPVNP
jgi:hypothetical protein